MPMKTKNQQPGGKFFFDKHVFDSDQPDPNAPPPPPVFTEEEMAAARRQSYEDGKAAGVKTTQDSIQKQTAQTLERIAQDVRTLMQAERQREQAYEREAIALCLAMIQKMFPGLQERFAEDGLKSALSHILKKQEGQKQITVTVSPDLLPGIQSHLQTIKSQNGMESDFLVQEDSLLPPGACRLAWQDGGAVRNPEALAQEILQTLEEMLADGDAKRHDIKG